MWSDPKNMILIRAVIEIAFPDGCSPEFICITAFCHDKITGGECIFLFFVVFDRDEFDFVQIQKSVLNISDSEVRNFDSIFWVDFSSFRGS